MKTVSLFRLDEEPCGLFKWARIVKGARRRALWDVLVEVA